ncbi:PTS sugar transporter subunit IIA [Photobacterium sp. SDRW27]|uniref:PTS sugar transporter subunit IIA n=1 Tax=Photobacterium obscurum TaxID=2829490 RepID=UPI0022447DB8|nr:PTS sugar transporter subunit IIA [Photobacterium obscurum]MCW8329182.1 PTS sugar transporter subunit IIA [Photobacterium obscurum]
MIERRITFIIGDEGIPSWKLNQLKTLAGYFRAVVVMQNVTRLGQAHVEQPVRVMSLGCMPGDLCQLLIEGVDAELACMVLTDFLAEQFTLVRTSGKKKNRNACCIDSHDKGNCTFYLPFEMRFANKVLEKKQAVVGKEACQAKKELLSLLCQMLAPEKSSVLLDLMLKREEVSSTCMGNGIALPHIMSPEIEQPAIAVIQLPQPVEWGSNHGPVTRLIAMTLPAPPQRPHIQAFAHFSQALIEPEFCRLLTENTEPEALKAVILHTLSRPFHQ